MLQQQFYIHHVQTRQLQQEYYRGNLLGKSGNRENFMKLPL